MKMEKEIIYSHPFLVGLAGFAKNQLERIQKTFLWLSKLKIKNETLCSDFKHGGLKNVNIQKKQSVFNALG